VVGDGEDDNIEIDDDEIIDRCCPVIVVVDTGRSYTGRRGGRRGDRNDDIDDDVMVVLIALLYWVLIIDYDRQVVLM
jgi:hypothetical protein